MKDCAPPSFRVMIRISVCQRLLVYGFSCHLMRCDDLRVQLLLSIEASNRDVDSVLSFACVAVFECTLSFSKLQFWILSPFNRPRSQFVFTFL